MTRRAIAACGIALALLAGTTAAQNLLTNGGFETGGTGWTDWEDYPYDGDGEPVDEPGDVQMLYPGDVYIIDSYDGLSHASAQLGDASGRGGLYQTVTVTPGQTYRVSGAIAQTGHGDCHMQLWAIDGAWAGVETPGQPSDLAGGTLIGERTGPDGWVVAQALVVPSTTELTVAISASQEWATEILAGQADALSVQHLTAEGTLAYSPSTVDFGDVGEPTTQSAAVSVWNSGTGTLTFYATASEPWLSVSPASGTSTGPGDAVDLDLTIDPTTAPEGYQTAYVDIISTGGTGSVEVTCNILLRMYFGTGYGRYAWESDTETYQADVVIQTYADEAHTNELYTKAAVEWLPTESRPRILAGPDGICDTTAAGDDVQLVTVGQGRPGGTIDKPAGRAIFWGANATVDSVAAGDDEYVGAHWVTTGPDGICDTTAAEDDLQYIDVGKGYPNAYVIGPGPNGVIDSTPAGDDILDESFYEPGTEDWPLRVQERRDDPYFLGYTHHNTSWSHQSWDMVPHGLMPDSEYYVRVTATSYAFQTCSEVFGPIHTPMQIGMMWATPLSDCTSCIVQWRSTGPDNMQPTSQLDYGLTQSLGTLYPEPAAADASFDGNTNLWNHTVTLTGLDPDTVYYFKVISTLPDHPPQESEIDYFVTLGAIMPTLSNGDFELPGPPDEMFGSVADAWNDIGRQGYPGMPTLDTRYWEGVGRNGSMALGTVTSWGDGYGTKYQRFAVIPGEAYNFGVWLQSHSHQYPEGEPDGLHDHAVRIGIDPQGDIDPFDVSVCWDTAEWWYIDEEQMEHWMTEQRIDGMWYHDELRSTDNVNVGEQSPTVIEPMPAYGDSITVFLRTYIPYAVCWWQWTYWDEARLVGPTEAPAPAEKGALAAGWNLISVPTAPPDDVQLVALGGTDPTAVCIGPGPDELLGTVPAGDDVQDGETILVGPNGYCETTADRWTDDEQIIELDDGGFCIDAGANAMLETAPAGDDIQRYYPDGRYTISVGPNGLCDSIAGDGPDADTVHDGDPGNVFADLAAAGNVIATNLYKYTPGAGYAIYPSAGFTVVEPGAGYWLRLTTPAPLQTRGEILGSLYHMPLAQGWNMIGHPFIFDVPLERVKVTDGLETVSIAEASLPPYSWLQLPFYYYEGGYRTLHTTGGDSNALTPWTGYWVLTYVPGLELLVPPIEPDEPMPYGDFSWSQGAGPNEVVFQDDSTGGGDEWLWMFGDGGMSSEQNPTRTYSDGTYTVSLRVKHAGRPWSDMVRKEIVVPLP